MQGIAERNGTALDCRSVSARSQSNSVITKNARALKSIVGIMAPIALAAQFVLTTHSVLAASVGQAPTQAQEGVNQLEALPGTPGPCLIPGNCSIDGGADQGGGSSSPGGGSSFPSGPGTSGQGSCLPNPGGDPSPCGGDGPASQSRLDSGSAAGNPIDLTIGNKYQKEVDLPALPGVLGLEVVRHYNSGYARDRMEPGILGRGWKLSYETKLYRIGKTIQIIQADGARLIFNRDPEHPEQCSTTDARYGRIVIVPSDDSETYQWIWTHGPSAGRRLNFDQHGQLTRIEAPSGEAVELQYHDGLLNRVTDPQGRMLTLDYPSVAEQRDPWLFPGVKRIETPLGEILYTHGREPEELPLPMYREGEPPPPPSVQTEQERVEAKKQQSWKIANLERVEWRPAATDEHPTVKLYHYEDERHSNLLTGISVAGSDGKIERISRYGYDETGLAVLSERFDGSERVELTELVPSGRVGKPGHTVIADGKGNLTNYRHAQIGGRGRIIEARGTGCPGCGESNRHYRYDAIGREVETIQLDEMGRAESGIRRDYDAWGRLKGIGRVRYGTGTTETVAGQGQFLSNLWRWKKTATQASQAMEQIDWLIRYDYAEPHVDSKTGVLLALEKPMRITRPSVVEGKEHRIELEYNDAWQVTKVIETGYSPAVPTNVAHVEPSIPESTDPADDDGFIKTSTTSAGLVGWEERSGSQQNSRDNLNSEASVGWAKQAQRSVPTRTAVTNQPEIPTRNTSTNTDGGFVGWEERSGSQQQSAADLVVAKSSGTNISKTTLLEGLQDNFVRAKCSGTLDSTGRSDCPRLITRTTEYRYRKVNGRSVLVAIDGPLPNGSNGPLAMPTDSDIIHIFWDKQGNYPVRVLMPGGVARSVDREASGRVTRLRIEDGYSAGAYGRQLDYRYTAQGKLTQLTEQAWQISENGQPKATLERVLRAGYDAAGRLNRLETPGRIFDETTFVGLRAENRPNESTTGQDVAEGTTSPHLKVDFDAATRRASWLDTAGQSWLRASWGEAGTAAANELLKVESRTGRRAERRVDDFGRVVAIKNPGQGWQTARYDEADRLIETVDPRGAQRVLSYDRRGRLIEISSYAVQTASKPESRINYRYEGGFLREAIIRDEAGERQTHYEHDTFGRILQERQQIEWRSAKYHQAEFRIEYGYDAAGRRSQTTLIDGSGQKSVVRTHYDGQGRIERLALDGRYYGESDLVRVGAYRTIDGHTMATRFEHGNGRIEEWSAALEALEQEARFPNRGSADPYRPVGKQTEGLASFAAYETPDIDVFNNGRLDQAQPGFDAAGLPQSYSGTNGDWALDWNAAGQLVHMKRSVGAEIFFVHDAQGRRVAKQVVTTGGNGATGGQIKTTYFAYDGIQMIGETAAVDSKNIEAQGAIVHRTVYLGYRPVARIDLPGNTGWRTKLSGPEIRAIHTSVSGQVLQMTDARQKVLWQETEHLPGGITRIGIAGEPVEGWDHQPLRYVGQYHDAETGLSYHGARYYNPHTGRFISPDPAGIADALSGIDAADTLDLYLYAGGNPERYFDPDGAAKITYYLIDTNPTQGGNQAKGRWAFYLRDIAGDDYQYLYDANGTFLESNKNPLYTGNEVTVTGTFSSDTFASWNPNILKTENIQVDPLKAFLNHYAYDLISLDSFTMNIDDRAAQTIIDDLSKTGDLLHKYYCSGTKKVDGKDTPDYKLVFPDITFGSGNNAIQLSPGGRAGENDSPVGTRVAQGTDTTQCRQLLTPRKRFEVLKAATQLQESGRNCATPCPGEIMNGTGWRGGNTYPNAYGGWPASWGRTQFTTATFLGEIVRLMEDPDLSKLNQGRRMFKDAGEQGKMDFMRNRSIKALPDPSRTNAERLDIVTPIGIFSSTENVTAQSLLASYLAQYAKAERVGECWNFIGSAFGFVSNNVPASTVPLSYAAALTMPIQCGQNVATFTQRTGLSAADYDQMVTWWRYQKALQPVQGESFQQAQARELAANNYRAALNLPATTPSSMTNNETLNAWQTKAIMANDIVRRALLELIENDDRFNAVSDQVLWRESTLMRQKWPKHDERQIAASFAFYHNAGKRVPSPTHAYVTSFLKHWDKSCVYSISASRLSLDPIKQQFGSSANEE